MHIHVHRCTYKTACKLLSNYRKYSLNHRHTAFGGILTKRQKKTMNQHGKGHALPFCTRIACSIIPFEQQQDRLPGLLLCDPVTESTNTYTCDALLVFYYSVSKTSFYRPRTKYERRYCFHRCLSVNISGGGGVPHPRSGWWGGYPRSGWLGRGYPRSGWWEEGVPQVWMVGRGVPQVWMVRGYPRSGWWGVPGVPPSQVWMVGGGTPGLDGGLGYTPPSQLWMVEGYPRSGWWGWGAWGTPPPHH